MDTQLHAYSSNFPLFLLGMGAREQGGGGGGGQCIHEKMIVCSKISKKLAQNRFFFLNDEKMIGLIYHDV